MLEERRNPALRRTLDVVGAGASRHVYEKFPGLLIHSYEPRSGAALMEWLVRELSLVDLAVVIQGLADEATRWIANLTHRDMRRAFITYSPEKLTDSLAAELEIEHFDVLLAPSQPALELPWRKIPLAVAPQDLQDLESRFLPVIPTVLEGSLGDVADVIEGLLEPELRL